MAPLYGRLQGNRGEATRTGSKEITARLETWGGAVEVTLERDSSYVVRVGEKHSPTQPVVRGNVNEREEQR